MGAKSVGVKSLRCEPDARACPQQLGVAAPYAVHAHANVHANALVHAPARSRGDAGMRMHRCGSCASRWTKSLSHTTIIHVHTAKPTPACTDTQLTRPCMHSCMHGPVMTLPTLWSMPRCPSMHACMHACMHARTHTRTHAPCLLNTPCPARRMSAGHCPPCGARYVPGLQEA
eukprot:351819-Chlamydomonas_euryale.AAC.4